MYNSFNYSSKIEVADFFYAQIFLANSALSPAAEEVSWALGQEKMAAAVFWSMTGCSKIWNCTVSPRPAASLHVINNSKQSQ